MIEELIRDRPGADSLFPRLTLAEIEVARGQFDAAERLLAEMREAGAAVGQPEFAASCYASVAESAIRRGQYAVAGPAVADGLAAVGGTEHQVALLRLCVLGLRNEAAERLRRSVAPGTARPDLGAVDSAMASLGARADQLVDSDTGPVLPDVAPLLLQCRAERGRASGATDQHSRWVAVAEAWEALGRPYQTGYARWRAAEAAARDGSGAIAREAARAAYRLARQLGAAPLWAEIEALARRARIDLATGEPEPPSAPPPDDRFKLTPREWDVLGLLCEGRTNQQIAEQLFISVKTASVHVTNILAKLGVNNRTEAAAAAHRLRLLD